MNESTSLPKSPADLGYRMPAEWEPHEATWLVWPHNYNDWPGKFAAIAWVYSEIVRHLSKCEIARIIAQTPEDQKRIQKLLKRAGIDMGMIEMIVLPTNRGWIRDSGAIVLVNDDPGAKPAAAQFHFNAWAKYDDYELDQTIPAAMAGHSEKTNPNGGLELIPITCQGKPFSLEGGAIDVNGKGDFLAAEECLLNQEIQVRNPGLRRDEIEAVLRDSLGAANTLWLGKGIVGDDTHGHVDDLCRFVNPSTMVLCSEQNESDDNYGPLRENWERIQDWRLANGSKPEVVALPMPQPVVFEGMRLPASYANFYIANGVVLVPTFNDPNDRNALGVLSECFPERTVVGIHAVDLVWGLGTIHCLTREHPKR